MHDGISSHLDNIIWKLSLPEKCKLFNWSCYHNKLLTADVLSKKGLVGPSICTLSYSHEEDANDLFLHCKFSSAV